MGGCVSWAHTKRYEWVNGLHFNSAPPLTHLRIQCAMKYSRGHLNAILLQRVDGRKAKKGKSRCRYLFVSQKVLIYGDWIVRLVLVLCPWSRRPTICEPSRLSLLCLCITNPFSSSFMLFVRLQLFCDPYPPATPLSMPKSNEFPIDYTIIYRTKLMLAFINILASSALFFKQHFWIPCHAT